MKLDSNKNIKALYICTIFLLVIFLLGVFIRVRSAIHFPFLADESYITQNGVRDMFGVGPDSHLDSGWSTRVFGVPLRNGQFLGPLWWWMQVSVFELIPNNDQILFMGADTKVYRILPFVWGIIGIAVFYRIVRKFFLFPVPEIMTCLLSVADLHVFLSVKAQYAETILFVATIMIAYVIVQNKYTVKHLWFLLLGMYLSLLVFLPKGIAIVSVVVVMIILQVFYQNYDKPFKRFVRKLQTNWITVLLVFSPMFIWWLGAERFFQSNNVRVSDLGYYSHFWEPILALTMGYGDQVKTFTTGPWYWPLLVYTHADIWPTYTFLAMPMCYGIIISITRLVKKNKSTSLYLYVIVAIFMQVSLQIWKGVDGARYHMIYFPACLLASSLYFQYLWTNTQTFKNARIMGSISMFCMCLYVYFMLGWKLWLSDWVMPGRWGTVVLIIGFWSPLLFWIGKSCWVRRFGVLMVFCVGVCLSIVRGPLHWGMFAYEEPGNINTFREQIETIYHSNGYESYLENQTKIVYKHNLSLIGYDIVFDENNIKVTSSWGLDYKHIDIPQKIVLFIDRALDVRLFNSVDKSYHMFFHVLDAESGELIYGDDRLLIDGKNKSVDEWRFNSRALVTNVISKDILPPGIYRIGVGLYDVESGDRLPISRGNDKGNDWLLLDNVLIEKSHN
ncbi:MAG TPA: hypothetical protein DCL76_05400 [Chloroflexi bacterium]|nr:hypothetical protein [Chloroflexota bacterium]HCU97776.1 hypothetical protein [Chloroflexota bacterium]